MSKPRGLLTELELEIMKVVWDCDTVTVRDVYERLATKRKLAYTTVMTMMKILVEKGFVARDDSERTYVYRATKKREQVLGRMVRDFVDRVFSGSAEPLLVQLVDDRKLSQDDIERLAEYARKASAK